MGEAAAAAAEPQDAAAQPQGAAAVAEPAASEPAAGAAPGEPVDLGLRLCKSCNAVAYLRKQGCANPCCDWSLLAKNTTNTATKTHTHIQYMFHYFVRKAMIS